MIDGRTKLTNYGPHAHGDLPDMLVRAFIDDPMWKWLYPGERRRIRPMRWLFGRVLSYGHRYGVVDVAGRCDGAAIWLGPDDTKLTSWRMARSGMLSAPFRMGLNATARFSEMGSVMDQEKARLALPQHWYLWAIGVDPAVQGKGIGRRLIESGLGRAGESGHSVYLETMVESNLGFYRRFGFEVAGEFDGPDGVARVWQLLREA